MFQVCKITAALAWLVMAISFSSCGYSLVGRGSVLSPDIRSIHIPVFSNTTGEPDVETAVTRSIKDRFIQDGRLAVVGRDLADSTLSGTIEKYELRPLSYDEQNNVTSYAAHLKIQVVHTAADDGRVLSRRKVDTNEVYKVDASVSGSENQRMEALKRSAATAAESVLSLVVESF